MNTNIKVSLNIKKKIENKMQHLLPYTCDKRNFVHFF